MIDPRLPAYAVPPPEFTPKGADPDNPGWSVGGGIGVWGISVLLIFITALAVQIVWFIRFQAVHGKMPTQNDVDANVTFWTIISTFVAHLLTLAICLVFIRRTSKVGVAESLGLDWFRNLTQQRVAILTMCVLLTPVFLVIGGVFQKYIPSSKTQLDEVLRSGLHVRIAIALIAAFSAHCGNPSTKSPRLPSFR